MKVIGFAGWKNSGKTTLVEGLLRVLTARGLRVSTVKHAHHSFEIDQPGKDSYRHRAAGATEVVVASHQRWALIHEQSPPVEPDLDEILARMSEVDLVLVEGFKDLPFDKIEVFRHSNGKTLLATDDRHVIAIAADGPIAEAKVPVLSLDDFEAISEFITQHCGLVNADEPAAR